MQWAYTDTTQYNEAFVNKWKSCQLIGIDIGDANI